MESRADSPAAETMVPVSGFARSFISSYPIVGATITVLENGQQLYTDSKGHFGPFPWPVGKPITLQCEKKGSWWTGYQTIQTATLTVPPEGIHDQNPLKNISFQVPSNIAFTLFPLAMGITIDRGACQIAATITPPNTTLDDLPQGEAGVEVVLSPDPKAQSFYFGIIPFLHKTNPFERGLKVTSLDGGVAFLNVPEGIYTLTARKPGYEFTEVTIQATKGALINVSPPQGPIAKREQTPEAVMEEDRKTLKRGSQKNAVAFSIWKNAKASSTAAQAEEIVRLSRRV